jgi:ornithine cyclodeaminase
MPPVVGRGTTVTWASDADVEALLGVADVISLLDDAFALHARGAATILPRAHAAWDGGLLHAVGAVLPGAGVSGVKTWTWTPLGARPVVVVFSTDDGSLRGVVDGASLGRLRTAATAGLGTRLLARPGARSLAIIGTGRQALAQVEAVAAVRPIEDVRVVGRDPGRRAAFARDVRRTLGVSVTEHDAADAAIRGADVVTTVTRSATPVLHGARLEPGMHVNAVGAIVPTSRELDTEAVARCATVAVEWLPQARNDAGDLRAAAGEGQLRWSDVVELGALVTGAAGRRDEGDITLLRTLGVGLADVAVASAVLDCLVHDSSGSPTMPSPHPAMAAGQGES